MAINKITFPTGTQPTSLTDYQSMLNVLAANAIGPSAIGITEFENTSTIPKIKDGTLYNVGGSLFQADADTTISGSAASGENYIYFSVSGTVATPTWTATAPTWSYLYNHYVTASGDYVLPVVVNWDGASAYFKTKLSNGVFSRERTNNSIGLVENETIISYGTLVAYDLITDGPIGTYVSYSLNDAFNAIEPYIEDGQIIPVVSGGVSWNPAIGGSVQRFGPITSLSREGVYISANYTTTLNVNIISGTVSTLQSYPDSVLIAESGGGSSYVDAGFRVHLTK